MTTLLDTLLALAANGIVLSIPLAYILWITWEGDEKVMRYVVLGWRTEKDAREKALPEVVSGHYSLMTAVKESVKCVDSGNWHVTMVAKLLK